MTHQIIEGLVGQAAAVRSLGYGRIVTEWLVLTVFCLAGVTLIYGPRPDMGFRLNDPLFLSDIALNGALVLGCGLWASTLGFPDRARTILPRALAGCLFLLYSGMIFYVVMQGPQIFADALTSIPHGLECLICILSFAAAPAVWMFWRFRQLASPQPVLMGLAVVLTAIATGCLGISFVESEYTSAGLVLWHYVPLVVLPVAGLWLGKKFFRW